LNGPDGFRFVSLWPLARGRSSEYPVLRIVGSPRGFKK
jgi:hypothetical protein